MGVIPIVNENDTVSTDELSLRIMIFSATLQPWWAETSDFIIRYDGLYTDDPHQNKDAKLITLFQRSMIN